MQPAAARSTKPVRSGGVRFLFAAASRANYAIRLSSGAAQRRRRRTAARPRDAAGQHAELRRPGCPRPSRQRTSRLRLAANRPTALLRPSSESWSRRERLREVPHPPPASFPGRLRSGGTMAYRVALRNPERFAAAVSFGGPFPEGETPLISLRSFASSRCCSRIAAIRRATPSTGFARSSSSFTRLDGVTLRQYPCDDEMTTQMLADLDRWLMEQVTGVAAEQRAEAESEWN